MGMDRRGRQTCYARGNPAALQRHLEGHAMKRQKTNLKVYDFTHLCQHCGYKIPPRELVRLDSTHIRCPKCGKDTEYLPAPNCPRTS
jgi:hypothetical protein